MVQRVRLRTQGPELDSSHIKAKLTRFAVRVILRSLPPLFPLLGQGSQADADSWLRDRPTEITPSFRVGNRLCLGGLGGLQNSSSGLPMYAHSVQTHRRV